MSFIHPCVRTNHVADQVQNWTDGKKNVNHLDYDWSRTWTDESFGQKFFIVKIANLFLAHYTVYGRSVGPPSAPPPTPKKRPLRINTIHINYLFLVQNGEFCRKVTSLQVWVVLVARLFTSLLCFYLCDIISLRFDDDIHTGPSTFSWTALFSTISELDYLTVTVKELQSSCAMTGESGRSTTISVQLSINLPFMARLKPKPT